MEISRGKCFSAFSLNRHSAAENRCSLPQPRWRANIVAACIGLAGLLFSLVAWGQQTPANTSTTESGPASSAVDAKYEIRLPSRTFIPQLGVPTELTKRIEEIIAGRDKARAHLFVQLHRPPSPEDRVRWARQGLNLLAPINRHTWRASVTANGATMISRIKGVRWADVIRPEDKLAKSVQPGTEPFAYQLRPTGRVAYSVLFHKDVTAEEVLALSRRIDVELEDFDAKTFTVLRTATVTVPPGGIEPLARADIVAWIEAVPPPDEDQNLLNAQPLSNVDIVQVAPFGLDGTGITVGVWEADDTVYDAHLDLTPRVIVEAGQTANNDDHAAHVAGTVGASGVNVVNAEGMAPNVTITSWDSDNDAAEMINAVTSIGGPGQPTPIQISNHSYDPGIGWNGAGTVFTPNQDLFGRYTNQSMDYDNIVFQHGLIVAKSAGNNRNNAPAVPVPGQPADCLQGGLGVEADCITPRGSAKNVITVGAMTGAAGIAGFSGYGPTDDGRIKPDLMAHGFNIRSLACNCFDDRDGDGLDDAANSTTANRLLSGTSMSTPVVAGVAALVLQEANALNIAMTPARMKALLVQTAQDVQGVGPSTPGPDFSTGWGIVDAEAAITLLREGGITEGTLTDTDTDEPAVWIRPFSVLAGEPEMHVTLAWDDPPGTPGGQILVNDLDLRLIAPDGTVVTPWILDPANPAVGAVLNGGNDAINNVEQVLVPNPMAGIWTAQVSANAGNLPDSPQVFALAGPVGLTIVEPTEAQPAWAGTSTDGNRVFVRLVGAADLDMSLGNLSIVVDGVALLPGQIALHSIIETETWLVITPGAKPVGCYDLTVSLIDMPDVTDTAPQSLCYEDVEDRMVDRVVAIDRTNSMNYDSISRIRSEEKMNAARVAGQFFVDLSNDQDGIGVVSFQRTDENGNGSIDADELSEPEFPFTLAIDGGIDQRPAARDAITAIEPGPAPGGVETSLGAGLLEAKTMLDDSGRPDSEKIIVLVTDGRENFPPYWSNEDAGTPVKPDFTDGDEIRIDAVSIGLDAENEILLDMTDTTGGTLRNELEGTGSFGLLSRLASTFKAIDEDNRGEQRFYYRDGFPETTIGGEFDEIKEGLFTVEPHLDWLTVAFHWSTDDAVSLVRLFDPTGIEISTTSRRNQKHAVYHVLRPEAGVWRYEVTITNPTAEFFAIASGPTLLTARLRIGATTHQGHGTWGAPLRVWIAEESAVLDAEVSATIRRPDKHKVSFTLRDDGASVDGDDGDGVYGVLMTDTLSGPYFVDVIARGVSDTGEPFERFMTGTFLIPGEPDSPGQVGEDPPGLPGPPTTICGGPIWCCWLWLAFIVALIVTLLWLARFLCNRDAYRSSLLWALLALAVTILLGWWLLKLCAIALCWFLLSVALVVIVAGLIACFTPFVPCIGWRRRG